MTQRQLYRRCAWTTVSLRRALIIFFGLLCFLTVAGSPVYGQQLTCTPWNQVPEYKGTITVNGSGTMNQQGEVTTINESATISIDAITNVLTCDSFLTWPSQVNVTSVTYSIDDATTSPCIGGGSQSITSQGVGTSSPGVILYFYAAFAPGGGVFNFQANTYSVAISDVVPGQQNVHTCEGSVTPYSNVIHFGPVTFNNDLWIYNIRLPASLGTLSGSTIVTSADMGNPPGLAWTISWNLRPVQNFDVIVTIPGYDTWRPSAGNVESDTGPGVDGQPGFLTLTAQLVDKTSGQPSTVVPDKVTFGLADFSHEPGVSLNWPPAGQAVSTPDLTFDPLFNPPPGFDFTSSPNGTSVDFDPSVAGIQGLNTYVAFLSSHDWGAWATLNVSMTVSGVPYPGHLQLGNGQSVTDILIPERQPGSHIADIWKTQHNVPLSTPDSDDSEVDPQGRSDCVGDGFTLYEEYRGFMENGKHIEGDPHNKDFFILNEIGADAEPGIFLFTSLTGLTVHKDIQKNEVEMTSRPIAVQLGLDPPDGNPLINFNVGQGAFEIQQHGVLIRTCDGFDGGQTLWPNAGPTIGDQTFAADHAQPGITDMICMQERDAPGAINPGNTHGGSITPVNALLQYDVAVAHELLHSAGVLHHGDRDDEGPRSFTLLFPSDPRNTTGQPVFQLAGQNVLVLDEQSGQDQAISLWNELLALTQQCDAMKANPGAFPPSVADQCATFVLALTNPLTGQLDTFWDESFWVGEPQGKHSGNDQCVMRYFVANTYPSVAPLVGVPVFYTVPAGTEPVGFSLCTSPAGTGVNDPNRTLPTGHPQPRYFDARSGRGACQKWVCVNDFYAPAADSQ